MSSIIKIPNSINFVKQEFTTSEQRLLTLIMDFVQQPEQTQKIKSELTPLQAFPIEFNYSQLGIKDYTRIKELSERLLKRQLNYKNSKTQEFQGINIFTAIKAENQKLYLEINYYALQIFVDFGGETGEGFEKIDKNVRLSLNGQYSIRLFDLLSTKIKLKTWEIKLSELRELLGIGESEYSNWSNFRIAILEKAQKEFEKKSNLRFDYLITEKDRKKVVKIKFSVSINAKEANKSNDDAPKSNANLDNFDNLRSDKKQSNSENNQTQLFSELSINQIRDMEAVLFSIGLSRTELNKIYNTIEKKKLRIVYDIVMYIVENKSNIDKPLQYFFKALENNSKQPGILSLIIDSSRFPNANNQTKSNNENAKS